ncbi:MAG: histidine kinase N-terminal 7TM domain-containing protein, partial [Chloroflexota bacterium]|nr:histidine kinase N-terminal 7TM domain-containing protein [Chloroflexota bacterium]
MMHLVYTPYIIPMLVAAVVSAALSAYVWQRRSTAPGATALALLMLALTVWLVTEALCIVNTELSTRLISAKVEYLGIVSVPVLWLVFALQYTGRQGWLTRRRLALIAICPAITLLLVWTNEAHGLIWAEYSLYQHGSVMISVKTYGAWFWIQVAYSYSLLFAGVVLVIRSAISSFWLYRRQASIILIGMLVPTVSNALYIFH